MCNCCVVAACRAAAATSLCCCAEAAQAAMTVGVANVLCDERPAPLAWPAPPTAAPPAPLWPYPGESPPTDICDPGSYAPTALRDRRFSDIGPRAEMKILTVGRRFFNHSLAISFFPKSSKRDRK